MGALEREDGMRAGHPAEDRLGGFTCNVSGSDLQIIAAHTNVPLLTSMLARRPTWVARVPVSSGAKKLISRPQLKMEEAVDLR